MPRIILKLLPPCLLLLLSTNLLAADWRKYQSDNFTIYSDARRGRVETVLNDFEEFRAVARFFLNLGDQQEHTRTRIYMFRSGREFRSFIGERNIAGFYINALGGPRLVIGPARGNLDYKATLFHEYVHYLMMSNTGAGYPLWYSEGMAELLSSVYRKFDYVAIGDVPKVRLSTLENFSRMPVDELISLGSSEKTSGMITQARLYAGAWVFTHFLAVGNFNDEHGLRGPLLEYLRGYQQGLDPLESFPEIFAMSPGKMDNLLDTYVRRGSVPMLRFDSDYFVYEGEVTSEKMEAAEASFLLASLASDMGNSELTLEYLQAQSSDDHTAHAASLSAVTAGHLEDYALADSRAEYAASQETLNTEALVFLSHYWSDYATERSITDPAVISQALERAVDYSVQAINRDSAHTAAYFYLARALGAQGKPEDAENVLWVALDQYPGSLQVAVYILRLLISQGEYDLAVDMLSNVYSATHTIEERQKLTELRGALEATAAGESVNLGEAVCTALGC